MGQYLWYNSWIKMNNKTIPPHRNLANKRVNRIYEIVSTQGKIMSYKEFVNVHGSVNWLWYNSHFEVSLN